MTTPMQQKKGLRQHVRIKHRISQLDGFDESSSQEYVSDQTDDSLSLTLVGRLAEDGKEYFIGETFWDLPDSFDLSLVH